MHCHILTYTKYILSIVGEMLEQCSSTVLTYNVLAICTNNLTNNSDKHLWYSTYTSIVTMVMKVLHNIYNMCSHDLP